LRRAPRSRGSRPRVAGDLTVTRDQGSEAFSDLDRYGDQADFVNTVIGEGAPGIQATPDILAYICWLYFGQESVVGAGDPYTHTITPGTNGGFWSTWWKRVGQNVILRQKFGDCRMGGLTIEGSTGAKVVRVTPSMISLNAGVVYAAPDPATAIPVEDPFLYTEGRGTFDINGTVFAGQSQFTATWDEGRGPYYGDDVEPVDLVEGQPTIGIATTFLVDQAGLEEYNRRIYGTAAPAAAAEPLKDLDAIGSYEFTLTKRDSAGVIVPSRTVNLRIPGVRWNPNVAIPVNPAGGAVEISLGGSMRKVAGEPASEIVIENGNAAYVA
jgi:hypothetical protein